MVKEVAAVIPAAVAADAVAVAKEEKTATAVVPAVTSSLMEALLDAAGNEDGLAEVEALLAKGANVKAVDEDGDTPLHMAAVRGHRDRRHAARTRRRCEGGGSGGTPRCTMRRMEVTPRSSTRFAHGANAKAADKDEQTPLHLAAGKVHRDRRRADRTRRGRRWTRGFEDPLHRAAENGHSAIVDALLKARRRTAKNKMANRRPTTP